MIIVYSTPSCVQCVATKREMERQGLGYKQAPVVIAGEDHWSGFRPDKIGALV